MTPNLDSWGWKNTSPSLRKQQHAGDISPYTGLAALLPTPTPPPEGIGGPGDPSWCDSSGVIHQVSCCKAGGLALSWEGREDPTVIPCSAFADENEDLGEGLVEMQYCVQSARSPRRRL